MLGMIDIYPLKFISTLSAAAVPRPVAPSTYQVTAAIPSPDPPSFVEPGRSQPQHLQRISLPWPQLRRVMQASNPPPKQPFIALPCCLFLQLSIWSSVKCIARLNVSGAIPWSRDTGHHYPMSHDYHTAANIRNIPATSTSVLTGANTKTNTNTKNGFKNQERVKNQVSMSRHATDSTQLFICHHSPHDTCATCGLQAGEGEIFRVSEQSVGCACYCCNMWPRI